MTQVHVHNHRNGCLSSCFMSFVFIVLIGAVWSALAWMFHGWGLLVGVPMVLGVFLLMVASARRKARAHAPVEDVEMTEAEVNAKPTLDERLAARRVRIDQLRDMRDAHRKENK